MAKAANTLSVGANHLEDGSIELKAPELGLWRNAPAPGTYLCSGSPVGELEILGVLHPLVLPDGASGRIVDCSGGDVARRPVAYGDRMIVLAPFDDGGETPNAKESDATVPSASPALVFAAPMSGRFFSRPSPDKAPFLEPGQTVRDGQTVCLLEVMKTYNRLSYGGPDLPAVARVVRVVPSDGDDLVRGDSVLELEAP